MHPDLHQRTTPDYQSGACRIGRHGTCRESTPPPGPAVEGVIYELCVCVCHTRAEVPAPVPDHAVSDGTQR